MDERIATSNRSRGPWSLRAWLTLALCLAAPGVGLAQDTQPTSASQPAQPEISGGSLTLETVQARIREVEAATDLGDTARLELLGLYRQIREQLELAQSWAAKARDFIKAREDTPARLEQVRRRLEALGEAPTTQAIRTAQKELTLETAAQALADAESAMRAQRLQLDDLENQAKSRLERRDAITQQMTAANSRLERARLDLSQPAPANLPPQIAAARRMLADAQRLAAQEEARALNEETRLYAAQSEALVTFREEARHQVSRAEAEVSAWRAITSDLRQAEVDRQQREAELALSRAPQAVRQLAEETKRMADERTALAPRIDELNAALALLSERQAELAREQASLLQGVQSPAIAESLSPRMRRAREELNLMRDYERALQADRQQLTEAVARQTELQDRRFEVSKDESKLLDAARAASPADAQLIRTIIKSHRETLEGLAKDLGVYEAELRSLIDAQSALLSKVDEFRLFIDKHVLWVRSAPPIGFKQTWPESLGRGAAFNEALALLGRHMAVEPLMPAAVGLVVLALLLWRLRIYRGLRAIAERVANATTDSYRLTLFALLYTLALAAPWAVLAAFVSSRLTLAVGAADIEAYRAASALSFGLQRLAVMLFALELARAATVRRGLLETHFRWNADRVAAARVNLLWYEPLVCCCVFIAATLERHPDPLWSETVGRSAFLAGMIASALFAQRLLWAGAGAVTTSQLWTRDFNYLWFIVAVAAPLALALAAAAGYYYTAVQFAVRIADALKFVFVLLMVHALLMRWLFVAQRKLALEQARRKRELAEAKEEGAPETPLDDQKINLVSISAQTRKIVRSGTTFAMVIGLWFIWVDLVPSLDFIDQVEFWPHVVEVVTPAAEPGAPAVVSKEVRYITLGHVVVSLITIVVTFVLARNIPGLLEIALLQRLEIDNGARIAISTLARYLITIVGVAVAFGSMGINWSQLQWLVAAISVGLGFGLQEIVANFVCGLILLFERPIRVGDIITVGNVEGRVTRIQMRATTIMDPNRREQLVPNKDLVTGQVINWTLTDPITRIVIPVSVARDADTTKVEAVLLKVARDCPYVLADPAPTALFRSFGDSRLNFELYVFLGTRDQWRELMHEMHMAIHRELTKVGIEIAFPQLDVHVHPQPLSMAPQIETLPKATPMGLPARVEPR